MHSRNVLIQRPIARAILSESTPVCSFYFEGCQINHAKTIFLQKPGHARWNLVISHMKRKITNRSCFEYFVQGPTLKCRLGDELVGRIYRGCPLIGCANHKNLINGQFLQVKDWTEVLVILQDIENQETLNIAHEDLQFCRLGWSMTYQQSQGRSLKEKTRICDTSHRFFTSAHLSLGISRVTDKNLVDLAN